MTIPVVHAGTTHWGRKTDSAVQTQSKERLLGAGAAENSTPSSPTVTKPDTAPGP